MFSVDFLLVLMVFALTGWTAKLPASFKRCDRKEPDFDRCFKEAVQESMRLMAEPLPEIGSPSLDPLNVPSLTIGAGTSAVAVEQKYKNVKMYGFPQFRLDDVKMNFDTKTLTIDGVFPQIRMDAEYELNGQILMIPIKGEGPCLITLDHVRSSNSFQFEEVQKRGSKYLKFVSSKMTMEPQHVSFKFDNLFGGNEALSDNINRVLNENWSSLFADVKSSYETAYAAINLGLANNVFSRVPLSEIFKDN